MEGGGSANEECWAGSMRVGWLSLEECSAWNVLLLFMLLGELSPYLVFLVVEGQVCRRRTWRMLSIKVGNARSSLP